MKWTNWQIPEKFDEKALKMEEGRLVIPFFDKNNKMHCFQGRSLKKDSPLKYITIRTNESVPKIFGLDKVNDNKKYYVLEGPIDSIFLFNSVACAGGDLSTVQ
jgi:DNA primase